MTKRKSHEEWLKEDGFDGYAHLCIKTGVDGFTKVYVATENGDFLISGVTSAEIGSLTAQPKDNSVRIEASLKRMG